MKKLISAILVLTLVLAFASSAMAYEFKSLPFSFVTDSTSVFNVGPKFDKVGNSWYIAFSESRSNVSPTHRAVTRVHLGAKAISATWVVSENTYSIHPYIPGYTATVRGATYRARLDDRDSGTLQFHGDFYYYPVLNGR